MSGTRKRYSRGFKIEAIKLVERVGLKMLENGSSKP